MYFADVIRVLLRRWYVVLVGMVFVFGALVYASKEVATQWQSTGQVLILLPPKATGPNTPTNPYMNLSPGLVTTSTLIAEQLNNNVNHADVKKAGFTSEYALGVAPDTGPLLVITAKDVDPEMAHSTMEEIARRIGVQLERMQANLDIPENQLMYTRRNDTNTGAEALPGSKIRASGVLGGTGIILTVVAAFLVDGFARRRKTRREADVERVPESDPKPAANERKLAAAAPAKPSKPSRPTKPSRPSRPTKQGKPAKQGTQARPRPRVVSNAQVDDGQGDDVQEDADRPTVEEATERQAAGAKRR